MKPGWGLGGEKRFCACGTRDYEKRDRERHLTAHQLQFNSHARSRGPTQSEASQPHLALYADQWRASAQRAMKNFNEVLRSLRLSFLWHVIFFELPRARALDKRAL